MGLVLKVLEKYFPVYVKYEKLLKFSVDIAIFALFIYIAFIARPVAVVCPVQTLNISIINTSMINYNSSNLITAIP